ncbi:MAG: cold shock domain-containing protein [Bacteroidota bacterium]
MPKGVVQFFIPKKGYGYVKVPESREEFYVKKEKEMEDLKRGDWVEFELKETRQGLVAVRIKKLTSNQ